jgi:AcrR family transcriptional regulator
MTRAQIEEEILDAAALLFARHGFDRTSLQQVADAVGYSKAGLIHHYPNKQALQDGVLEQCRRQVTEVAVTVAPLAVGPERDYAVIAALVDLSVRFPGAVALMLSPVMHGHTRQGYPPETDLPAGQAIMALLELSDLLDSLFDSSGPDGQRAAVDVIRNVRVAAALGALAVGSLALPDVSDADIRAHLVEASFNALSHPR